MSNSEIPDYVGAIAGEDEDEYVEERARLVRNLGDIIWKAVVRKAARRLHVVQRACVHRRPGVLAGLPVSQALHDAQFHWRA